LTLPIGGASIARIRGNKVSIAMQIRVLPARLPGQLLVGRPCEPGAEDSRVVRVEGAKDHPITRGVCAKVRTTRARDGA
jgi:hypothetical protein